MKYIRAIFRDKLLLLGAFFILLPTGFQFLFGVEGEVFLANPSMPDPNFSFTVLYMTDHTIDGAEAIILNRAYPQNKKNKLPAYLANKKIPLYWGGPLDDETYVQILELRGDKRPKIMPFDKWVTEDIDILGKIENSPDKYRIYVGHAKWQAFQYEVERINQAWVFGVDRKKGFSEIFSEKLLDRKSIWLKMLYDSDFYKKQAIKSKITA